MNSIASRAVTPVNLKQFSRCNSLEKVGSFTLEPPKQEQYVLRMLIGIPFSQIEIPDSYLWTVPLIARSLLYQEKVVKIKQPFVYLTIRHGLVKSENDDEWHTDGFSMNVTHLPEQSYFWANVHPTEYVEQPINFPGNFEPDVHNIHLFIQDNIKPETEVKIAEPNTLYCFDPYVIHRRPKLSKGLLRTFVRVSFTPIEIRDDTNTYNPFIPTPKYNREGVKDFRDKLKRY